jgi:hypothetical protein
MNNITYRSVWKNTNTEIENTDSLWFAMNDDDSHLSKYTSFSHLFWEFIDVSVYFFHIGISNRTGFKPLYILASVIEQA